MKVPGIAVFAIAALAATSAAASATKGSCESKSQSLKSSQTVTLVDEWDPDFKENWGTGVYFLSFTLKRGAAFTVWTGPDEDVSLDVYTNNDDAYVWFDLDSLDDGTQFARVSAADWDEEDPSSVKFFVRIDGDIGHSVSVYSQSGYRSFVPQGAEDNPLTISFATSEKTSSISFVDGAYYMRATLSKGTIYRMRTEGGTADDPAALVIDADLSDGFIADPQYPDTAANNAYIFTPSVSGTYTFVAEGSTGCKIAYSAAKAVSVDEDGLSAISGSYAFGALSVSTPGAPSAKWTLDSDSTKYAPGSFIVLAGDHTLKFPSVSGYKATDATAAATVEAGASPQEVVVYYSDTFDPKDDTAKGATTISFKNTDTVYATRTLWENDPEDNFAFDGKDGYFYDIALSDETGSALFSVTNAEFGVLYSGVSSIVQAQFPKSKGKYYLCVTHAPDAAEYGGYSISGKFANVGSVKFAKTAATAKETDTVVSLAVNRTSKDGLVRVRYGTVAGTAKPGEDYIAQSGTLVWEDGDNKAKTIAVRLIPELVPVYRGDRSFSVHLEALEPEEREDGEYPAAIVSGVCAVTLKETSKAGATVESAYAAKAPKLAKTTTENVPLESGTFYGVLSEDGCALTNGLPALASVTLTAGAKAPYALSAKVAIAGKTYTFSAKGWDEESEDGVKTKTFEMAQKTAGVTYINTLSVTVSEGVTTDGSAWLGAGGSVELVMNVPDSNSKGVQEEIRYTGEIFRNNAKIQDYLAAVTNFTGYYTVALVPDGVTVADGIPAGNGYITLTVDNKGTVKVAGMLADGTTKPSVSVAACGLVEDETSANGYSLYVPVFFAKSPACFGGMLRLYAAEDGTVLVDSSVPLVWNNDNAKLTYSGEDGYRISLQPAGGWYDTVVNLYAYYLTRDFSVSTEDSSSFFAEALTANSATKDYSYSGAAQPDGFAVSLSSTAFSTENKKLVKSGSVYDFEASANPCNVQVKLARATGIVSGSFSLWSESEDGSKQKEITGLKHYGVVVMNREEAVLLPDDVVSAGFCTQTVKVSDVNPTTGKTTTRSWTGSLPFNILGVERGEPDWWAEDWGEDAGE